MSTLRNYIKLANLLDSLGHYEAADAIDSLIKNAQVWGDAGKLDLEDPRETIQFGETTPKTGAKLAGDIKRVLRLLDGAKKALFGQEQYNKIPGFNDTVWIPLHLAVKGLEKMEHYAEQYIPKAPTTISQKPAPLPTPQPQKPTPPPIPKDASLELEMEKEVEVKEEDEDADDDGEEKTTKKKKITLSFD